MTKVTAARGVTKRRNRNPLEQTDSPSDEYAPLVRAAGAGDSAAMERLLMRAQEVAWRFSLAVCGGADDAEDAMQEALVKTYRHAGQIREPAAFRPWLYRTVRNACLVSRRKKSHEPARLESLEEEMPSSDGGAFHRELVDPRKDPEQLAQNTALRARLMKALYTLPPPLRAIVFLREMEGLSTREVAAVMGISEDNVKTRLHRARLGLQRALAEQKR